MSWKELKYREVYLAVGLGAVLDSWVHLEVVDYLSTNTGEYEGLLSEVIQLGEVKARKALLELIAEAAQRMEGVYRRQNCCQAVAHSAHLH